MAAEVGLQAALAINGALVLLYAPPWWRAMCEPQFLWPGMVRRLDPKLG